MAALLALGALAQAPATESSMVVGPPPAGIQASEPDTATPGSTPTAVDTAITDSGRISTTESVKTDSVTLPTTPDTVATSTAPTFSQSDSTVPLLDSTKIGGVRRMETTVVRGTLRGKLKARQERKDADNRKDVLAIESIQEHPDPDVADALARAPGITVRRSQGEGNYVQIRGSEPRLSTVTINGQKMTSSSGNTRAVDLGVIPVDQLSEIEVTKVLMPEMDGDAIGGTVNLVTPGAIDTHLVMKGLFAGGAGDLSGKPLWQGSAALSKRFFEDGALGVYLGGSWFKNRTRTDALELKWDTLEEFRNVIWNLEQREYHNQKERAGASARLDWRTPERSVAYLTGNWSRTDDAQIRDRFTINREGAQQISPAIPDSFASDLIKYAREVRDREIIKTVSQATLGGSTQSGPAAFDLSLTGSSSGTHQPPYLLASFKPRSLNSYIDPSDPDVPKFYAFYYPRPIAVDPRLGLASEYTNSGISRVQSDAQEDDIHGRADARLFLGGDSTWQIRVGGKWGWNHKDQDVVGGTMSPSDPLLKKPVLSLSQVVSSDSGVGFYDGHYTIGPLPDPEAIRSWLAVNGMTMDTTNSSNDHIQLDPQNYSVVMRHYAGYAEAKWRDGDFSAVGGVRLERYDIRSTGNTVLQQIDESWSATIPTTVDRTFDFVLPMVSARWSPTPQVVARASYTRSFSLPDAMDLLPRVLFDFLDQTVTVGNPYLKATVADALELDLEWYRKPRGMASIGVFAKKLTDYVVPTIWEVWDVIQKQSNTHYSKDNGDVAYLEGVELEAQQPLTFLPSVFSGLGIDGNYTWTHSSITLPGRTEESTLPGQSEHSANLGLRFDFHGFTAQMSGCWQSEFLYQVGIGTNKKNDTWVDAHTRVDASVSQRLGHGLLVYFQGANLWNTPYRLYTGDTRHPSQTEYNGRTFEGGIRLSL